MKKEIFSALILTGFINFSCLSPSEPIGIKSHLIAAIDTGGNCLDLDVDIADSILVAAANYNGYFVYKLNFENDKLSEVTEYAHISTGDMDNETGDNRAQTVVLSKIYNLAFVMDQYDHIWVYKYSEGAVQYEQNYLNEECFGGTWLSVTLNDNPNNIGAYFLIKHTSSGNYWKENSSSIVWRNLEGLSHDDSTPEGESICEYITNQGNVADKIFFSDSLLTLAYGELGVRIFKQTFQNTCSVDYGEGFIPINLDEDQFCLAEYTDEESGSVDYKSCCENTICEAGSGQCPWYGDGYGGRWTSSDGGITPNIFAMFDTPGEVEAIYSTDHTIFTGLSNSNGCLMVTLDSYGSILNTIQFAEGYTIKGIHADNDLIALAAGHDGIILFNWDRGSTVTYLGKLETPYANQVKVANNTIFCATEDGIEIIQLER